MSLEVRTEHYRVFCMVAHEGSFSAAARQLYISQPAVSQAIAQLEKALGVALLIRTPRGVRLTEEGQTLLEYVDRAFRLMKSGQKKLAEMRSLQFGRVAIGASDTLCRFFLMPYLSKFHEMHPDIALQITNCTSRETLEQLRSGNVELGFVNLPLDEEGFNMEPCFPVHDCFVVGEKFRSLLDHPLTPQEVGELPLMMIERSSNSRKFVDACFVREGVTLKPQIELESHELIAEFAVIGLGVGCVMREFVAREIQEGRLFELPMTLQLPARSIGMVRSEGIPLSTAAASFCRMIQQKEAESPTADMP